MFPIGIVLLLTAKIFYRSDIELPLFLSAIYAALSRKLWSILVLMLVVGCMDDSSSKIYFTTAQLL